MLTRTHWVMVGRTVLIFARNLLLLRLRRRRARHGVIGCLHPMPRLLNTLRLLLMVRCRNVLVGRGRLLLRLLRLLRRLG